MFLNIVLAAVAGLAQLCNSFLGWKVTLATLSPRQKRRYEALFVLIGLLGIGSVVAIAYRAGRQERAHLAVRVENSYKYWGNPASEPRFSWLLVGMPLSFKIITKSVGSGSAYNEVTSTHAFIEPDTTLSSQNQAVSDFNAWLKAQPPQIGETLARGDEPFRSADGNILSPEDVDNLTHDRRTAYVVAVITFEDDFGSHTMNLCRFIEPQSPLPPEFHADSIAVEIWGGCEVHSGGESSD